MNAAVLVTGASTGIGRATALHLATLGYTVYAGARSADDLQALEQSHALIRPLQLDVTSPQDIDAAFSAIRAAGVPLAGVVNNAGIAVAGPIEFLPLDFLRKQFDVNVFGQIAVAQRALPTLRRTGGRLIFIGSISGRLAAPFVGAYSASKAALASLVDALRQELRPFGIPVSLFEFAAVRTPIWGKGRAGKDALIAAMPHEALELYGEAVDKVVAQTQREEAHGLDPAVIARAVADVLKAPRPRERYVIGAQARVQSIAALLPMRLRDRIVAKAMNLP